MIVYILSIYLTMFEKEITIGQKYVRPAGLSTHYQIVDTEGNNYVLGDSVFLLEFNSADDYAMVKESKKYKVHGYWFSELVRKSIQIQGSIIRMGVYPR